MPVTETLELQRDLFELFAGRGAGICCVNGLYPEPSAEDRQAARNDDALKLWIQEADVQGEELRRLGATIRSDVIELPMLPRPSGPELLRGLMEHLGGDVHRTTGPEP
jgi:hypothetical protein